MSPKRITTVYIEEEYFEELKKRGLNISRLINELLCTALYGTEKTTSQLEEDIELILISMRTFANPYIKEKKLPDYMRRDSKVGLDAFIESRLEIPISKQRLIKLYKDPNAPFHNDEQFTAWCTEQWEKMMSE